MKDKETLLKRIRELYQQRNNINTEIEELSNQLNDIEDTEDTE